MQLNILFEDKHILVCEKPAGVPTQSKSLTAKDMVTILKNELAKQTNSNTEPYLGLIHRLDQPVGGIMVFAKTSQAAKHLSAQVQNKTMKKHYLAVITNDLSNQGSKPITLIDQLVQNKRDNSSSIVPNKTKDSKTAELTYNVLQVIDYEDKKLSLISVDLKTGRHHQIRVQTAAHLGGIWGDKKYNKLFQQSKTRTNLCLYAYRLEFLHPVTNKVMSFQNIPQYDLFNKFNIE